MKLSKNYNSNFQVEKITNPEYKTFGGGVAMYIGETDSSHLSYTVKFSYKWIESKKAQALKNVLIKQYGSKENCILNSMTDCFTFNKGLGLFKTNTDVSILDEEVKNFDAEFRSILCSEQFQLEVKELIK
jgi:hypothetical protein